MRREASCIHPPPRLFLVFSCPLQLEAYSVVVHKEGRVLFLNGHKGCQGQEGRGVRESVCDWLPWPPTCFGKRLSCPEDLSSSLLLIYICACSSLSGDSWRNFRAQLSALLYFGVSVVGPISLKLWAEIKWKWCDHKSVWQLHSPLKTFRLRRFLVRPGLHDNTELD